MKKIQDALLMALEYVSNEAGYPEKLQILEALAETGYSEPWLETLILETRERVE